MLLKYDSPILFTSSILNLFNAFSYKNDRIAYTTQKNNIKYLHENSIK